MNIIATAPLKSKLAENTYTQEREMAQWEWFDGNAFTFRSFSF
jgi:hypothetical protein